jgi:cation diffusion facilitator family transporter
VVQVSIGTSDTCRQRREVQRITLWGLAANLLLAVVKFLGGVLGASQALVVDAVHSLSDSATDLAVLVGAMYWTAPADDDHPHGHGRIETIITCAIGITLAAVGLGLAYRALNSLREPAAVPGWIAFYIACASMVGKEWLYRWTLHVGKRLRSSAVVANAWHHRSDALSSLPVAVAILGVQIAPTWTFLDPVAATIVAVLIVQAAWKIVWPALRQLSDVGASEAEQAHFCSVALATEGVQAVHALRTRHIGHGLQLDLHVRVDPDLTVREGHDIAHAVKRRLLEEGAEVVDVLVHVEPHE